MATQTGVKCYTTLNVTSILTDTVSVFYTFVLRHASIANFDGTRTIPKFTSRALSVPHFASSNDLKETHDLVVDVGVPAKRSGYWHQAKTGTILLLMSVLRLGTLRLFWRVITFSVFIVVTEACGSAAGIRA